jgi:two-component system sensor kinase FixL
MEFAIDYLTPTPAADAAQALQQARDLLACFQNAVGHDLPNQLVAIQGLARMLVEMAGVGLDEDGRALLTRLAALTVRADEQMRRLAALGRLCRELDQGVGSPQEAIPLAEAVREALAEVKVVFSDRAVRYHVGEALPHLPVSRTALHQVLVQLLRNAVQAAAPGRAAEVEVTGETVEGGKEFRVRDNGRGLSVEVTHLGEPGGPGLGLFLVRQVVARWRGRFHVCSQPGEGTTVGVFIPG